ncbi:hypothetical protein [Deinococcus peraridilitoris]|uniref:Secreted protein n=1 Tax=Deinococcus peraridilitoris (strain DSM 19664 / LMG 22246 / CIP 109416 / KR-200) TaxID=937777 RepID=L0A1J5_DEIPD|nr:hypothetical protein [Deinococcus peraridilitoris]AFZ67047.1 hypothetical protein Deipe_1506 [Deinococcus peraridilitoris DSM 19664]
MKRLLTLACSLCLSATAQPVAPPPTAHTPSTLVYGLAVKRNWTEQSTPFCTSRAASNISVSYPKAPKAAYRHVRTFGFTSRNSPTTERTMLDYTPAGFQVPYPWQVGQWMSRQYAAEATPGYAYLLEVQERADVGSGGANICMTVFSQRKWTAKRKRPAHRHKATSGAECCYWRFGMKERARKITPLSATMARMTSSTSTAYAQRYSYFLYLI